MILELKDVLTLLNRFIGHHPIYIYLVDRHNTVLWFNDYTSRIFHDLHVGQRLHCFKSMASCLETCEDCSERQEHPPDVKVQRNLIKGNRSGKGKEVWLEFLSLPIYSAGKQLEGILRIGIDVTENEKVQEKLREKEKLFTTIIDKSSDAVIFLDNQGIIESWNRGAQEIFGYPAADIIGESIELLIPEDAAGENQMEGIYREHLEDIVGKYETRRKHQDGHLIYVDISRTPIYDERGQLVGVSEIIKDINARKKLENELLRTIHELSKINELNDILYRTREEQEILRTILFAITAGQGLRFNRAFLLLADKEEGLLKGELAIGPSDKEEARRIWNDLESHTHLLRDIVDIYKIDLEGSDRKVNEIVKQIRVPLYREDHLLIKALQGHRVVWIKGGKIPFPQPCRWDLPDSDLIKLINDTFVIAPLFSKTEPLGLIIADNCINRREIASEDLESLKLFANQASSAIENARLYQTLEDRIQELQSAYRQLAENQQRLLKSERLATIGEMSTKIAHEIRNPLVAIGGFARQIEKKVTDDPAIIRYANIIRSQVANLEYILDNLMNIAKPAKPSKQLVNLNRIVGQVTQILKHAITQRHIELVTDFQAQNQYIDGDERMLHQAILNLIKNAIEAFEEQADNKHIHISTLATDDQLILKIRDNGPGIERSLMSKIFNSFFTTKSAGTGLGLTIVKQIVDSHNGKMKVRSRTGEGTTFSIKFPLAKDVAAKEIPQQNTLPD